MEQSKQKLLIISAPSGAGKTTLVRKALQHFDIFGFSISCTTRAPREAEKHGIHYYFISADEFRRRIDLGDFLEWEEVYPGRYYGTLKSEIDRIRSLGKHPIFDVDVEGGMHIKKIFEDQAVSVYIKPPSREALKERLISRGTDSPEEIELRFEKSSKELIYADDFDHVIINDELDTAVEELCQLIQDELVN